MVKTKIKVYGYHLDMYGHVNNARYLEFLETARWEFIENKMPLSYLDNLGIAFVVASISINYRRPAFLGQILDVRTHMAHISNKSAKIHQKILLGGTEKLVADADITFVIIDAKTQKVIPITGKIRKIIELFNT